MYRLFLFGGISLEDSSEPVSEPTVQRRRLALLSVLAAARSGHVSREKLLGLFWAEYPEEKARHSLANALYVLRRKLGHETVLSAAGEVRLNGDELWCDVPAFRTALARRERMGQDGDEGLLLEEAASLYRGPLLDGFYVQDAPAFEQWVETERRHLASRFARALEILAEEAQDRSDWPAAVRWWKRRAAHEPTNSRVVAQLMEALVAAGNMAGALRYARIHERILEEKLGLELPSDVREFAEELIQEGEENRGVAGGQQPAESSGEPPDDLTSPGDGTLTETGGATASRGAVREVAGLRPPPCRRTPRRWITSGLAALALLLVLAGGFFVFTGEEEGNEELGGTTAGERSHSFVAVLPFEDLSHDSEYSFLATGLHEELLTQLSKVADVKVLGRTSVMAYAGARSPLERISGELGVDHVVEGGVQVVDARLRVTVRLIDAATGSNLWAERYDGTLEDAFAIQADIAQRVVEAVGATLTDSERDRLAEEPTANPVAYRFYLHGRDYWNRPGRLKKNWEAAQELYERAVALDPEFALARAALSVVNGWMHMARHDVSPSRLERQREEAEAALRLAPELPQAHVAMGLWHYWGRRDYERALEEFQVALAETPNDPWLWQVVAAVHRRMGNWDSLFEAYRRAVQLDPLDADLMWDLAGNSHVRLGEYADAVRAYDRALSLVPNLHYAAVGKGWAYAFWRGDLDTLRSAVARLPDATDVRLQLHLLERNAEELLQLLRTTQTQVHTRQNFFRPSALYSAWSHRLRGDSVAARRAFDSALVFTDSVVREYPGDWRVHVARGLSLAGLDRRHEAVQEADWLQQSRTYEKDAMTGPLVAVQRARVLAQASRAEPAVDELERVLAGPTALSGHILRLDPLWDPIRDDSRFQRLVEKVDRAHGTTRTESGT